MTVRLIDLVASQQGHFRLESGYHSSSAIDIVSIVKSDRGVPWLTTLAERIDRFEPTAICGGTRGGALVVQWIASELDRHFVWHFDARGPISMAYSPPSSCSRRRARPASA